MEERPGESVPVSGVPGSSDAVRRGLRAHPADVVDVLAYVVVLNLAVEYFPSVITEGFTISLLTAVLLKVVLELVLRVKRGVHGRFDGATTLGARLTGAVALWIVLAGSKFVVLKVVDIVFGDSVDLGGFIPVTVLVVALLGARAAVRRLLFD